MTTKTTLRQVTGDIWDLTGDARCITTNGTLKQDERGVMGRGVARQAKQRYLGLERILGRHLVAHGNHVGVLIELGEQCSTPLVALPVKHDWFDKYASLDLIRQGLHELVALADERGWQTVLLPRAGCGNGQLKWEWVEPTMLTVLDGRFVVVWAGPAATWVR